ncbi:MAG: hypothetical protein M0Q23_00920 [Syntrophales bacterium]|jgi:hypothetical protein|nr:hypothetical protein [Syntrophales bacterium]MCK9527210.1 hypothetical protein [Syntrophales bacterium]MDX9921320.1 hypothetical protein [Syntrophales bacterium]
MKTMEQLEKLEMKIRQAETVDVDAETAEALVGNLATLFQNPASDVERLRELKRRAVKLLDNRKRLLLGEMALITGEARWQ